MRKVRRWIYSMGFRPRYGSVFYSPSLDLQHAMAEEKNISEEDRLTIEWLRDLHDN